FIILFTLLPSIPHSLFSLLFSFTATSPTEIYTLSLHDALPISAATAPASSTRWPVTGSPHCGRRCSRWLASTWPGCASSPTPTVDRKSTRLNSSHRTISYAVFCLKKKKEKKKKKIKKSIDEEK